VIDDDGVGVASLIFIAFSFFLKKITYCSAVALSFLRAYL